MSAGMITFLRGMLRESLPTHVVLDVHGVGYQVLIPLSTYDRLPAPGAEVELLTHLAIREDAHILYGFRSREERDLFGLLTAHVSGVGPKIALAVLSGMAVAHFKAAVVDSDIQALSRIGGVGKKTAERMVLELKDKVGAAAAWEAASQTHALSSSDQAIQDAVLALLALGYKQVDATRAVRKSAGDGPTTNSSEDLVRLSLRLLS